MKNLIVLITLVLGVNSFAADIPALKKLFKSEYNSLYQARFCGQNIENFIAKAKERRINLSNSYVAKIVGGGFLETSAFYTRTKKDDRVMLGYFHMILVADGIVFDFDLGKKKILDLNSYFRLQFTPPYEPFKIYGIDYSAKGNPDYWDITGFSTEAYGSGIERKIFEKKLNRLIDMKSMRRINRKRLAL